MQVNFLGPIRLTLALLPQMIERGGGRLVNLSSVAATLSSPGEAAYDTSKAALSVFSEAMAIDLWDDGIKVLVVYPGVVDTPLFTQPDNDPFTAPVEFITVGELVQETFAALDRDALEVYIPGVLQGLRHREGEQRRRASSSGTAEYMRQQRGRCEVTQAHPLDPITADEIRAAVALVAADDRYETDFVFAHLRLREPDKDGRTRARTRRARRPRGRGAARPAGPARGDRGRRVGHRGRDHVVDGVRRACAPRCCSARRSTPSSRRRSTPTGRPRCARRGITDLDKVQIDPWPAGVVRLRRARTAGASPAASRSSATTPTDNGYARPIEGRDRALRHRRATRCIEVDRPRRRRRCRRTAAATTPRTSRPLRDRPEAARRSRSPKARASRSTATSCAGRSGQFRVGVRSVRGARAAHRSRTTTTAGVRPILHRASITRDGRALRRPRPDARLEERVRRGRVGPRPHDATRSRSAATASARSTTSTRRSPTEQGEPWVDRERDLHARGGLRDPLEARRPAGRARARCAAAAASSSASSRPSATTSTASSGTSTSTATSSSR